jgi:AAA15 family ATPase/GTPase
MVAANISSKYKEVDEQNTYLTDTNLRLLKSKAIYGKNASGKSNIVKALVTFLKIVRHSVKFEDVVPKLIEPFKLSLNAAEAPTFFQLIFQPANSKTIFRYGFEVFEGKIVAEWLFGKSGRVEVPYFTRELMAVKVRDRFKEAKKFEDLATGGDSEIFRDNSLFLTAVSAVGGTFAKSVVLAIGDIIVVSGLADPRIKEMLQKALLDNEVKKSILELMQAADFDIEDVEPEPIDTEDESSMPPEDMPDELKELFRQGKIRKSPSFLTKRSIFNNDGEKIGSISPDLEDWESEGTKKLFFLSAFLMHTLKDGGVLVIDEFDARFHPLLTKKITQLFNSSETNKKGAQLIFATHDTNLLKANLLRRDQICFVDKTKFGNSTLRTLVEYKGVRNDASYEKDYLSGKYAATPFLNRMDQIFED